MTSIEDHVNLCQDDDANSHRDGVNSLFDGENSHKNDDLDSPRDDVNSLRDDVNSLTDHDMNLCRDDDANSHRDDDANSHRDDDANSHRDDDANSHRDDDMNSLTGDENSHRDDDDVIPICSEGGNSGLTLTGTNVTFDMLSFELLVQIVKYAVSHDIASRQFLPCVSRRFRAAVDYARRSTRDLKIHINPTMQETLGLASFGTCNLSVNRLIRYAGKLSGLAINIRDLMSVSGWYFAWLVLFRNESDNPGWFTIRRMYWRKK